MRRVTRSTASGRLAAWIEAGTPTQDLREGARVVAIVRTFVIALLIPLVFWAEVDRRAEVLAILAAVALAHIVWCAAWLRNARPITALNAAASVAGDTVAIGLGVLATGGPRSPVLVAWALNLTVAALWVGLRTALPLLGAVVVGIAAMAALGSQDAVELTDAQAAVMGAALLAALVVLSGSVAQRQRRALAAVSAAVYRARRDPLTGLLNRGALEERLAEEIARTDRYGGRLSLLMMDLDDFKDVNDRLGHHAGDVALIAVAREIGREKRLSDVAARFGGEEFVLVLPETDEDRAATIGERLRVRIANSHPAGARITISVGVACVPVHATDGASLMEAADRALYAAKHAGKDRVVVASVPGANGVVPAPSGATPAI